MRMDKCGNETEFHGCFGILVRKKSWSGVNKTRTQKLNIKLAHAPPKASRVPLRLIVLHWAHSALTGIADSGKIRFKSDPQRRWEIFCPLVLVIVKMKHVASCLPRVCSWGVSSFHLEVLFDSNKSVLLSFCSLAFPLGQAATLTECACPKPAFLLRVRQFSLKTASSM